MDTFKTTPFTYYVHMQELYSYQG